MGKRKGNFFLFFLLWLRSCPMNLSFSSFLLFSVLIFSLFLLFIHFPVSLQACLCIRLIFIHSLCICSSWHECVCVSGLHSLILTLVLCVSHSLTHIGPSFSHEHSPSFCLHPRHVRVLLKFHKYISSSLFSLFCFAFFFVAVNPVSTVDFLISICSCILFPLELQVMAASVHFYSPAVLQVCAVCLQVFLLYMHCDFPTISPFLHSSSSPANVQSCLPFLRVSNLVFTPTNPPALPYTCVQSCLPFLVITSPALSLSNLSRPILSVLGLACLSISSFPVLSSVLPWLLFL